MRYLLLIYEAESDWAQLSDEEQGKVFAEYGEFTDVVKAGGNLLGGEALQPTQTATTVRVRDGRVTTTDGPFAETREQLGGYYLLEAKDLDEALALAARIPTARTGCVEVRPILEYPE